MNLSYYHFKMYEIQMVLKFMHPKCFMASVDFMDAYYSVPVAVEDRKFCRKLNVINTHVYMYAFPIVWDVIKRSSLKF